MLLSLLLAVLLMAAQCTSATPPAQKGATTPVGVGPGITVSDVFVRATTENGAVYMTLTNTGQSDDALLGVKTDVARVAELHETTMGENDQMKMRPVINIPIPAGGSVTLKPGGLHVMLISMQKQLTAGDKIGLTLNFEKAKPITVEAEVMEGEMMKHN